MKPEKPIGVDITVTAGGQGQVTLPRPQRLRGQVQRDKRGRTRRVHGHRRALKTQHVGDPARDDAGGQAGAGVTLDVLPRVHHQLRVVLPARAGEDAGLAAAQAGRGDAGVLERLPARLEQQALLRVHGQGLARRDAEEAGVEVGHPLQETAVAGGAAAAPAVATVAQRRQVPAAVRGEPGDPVAAAGDQVPQLVRRGDAAG
nr:hypothetical protein GCM10020092_032010 [Actinoplanes digitatis]